MKITPKLQYAVLPTVSTTCTCMYMVADSISSLLSSIHTPLERSVYVEDLSPMLLVNSDVSNFNLYALFNLVT